MKVTALLHLMQKPGMLWLYLHFSICLYSIVLNQLSRGTTIHTFLIYCDLSLALVRNYTNLQPALRPWWRISRWCLAPGNEGIWNIDSHLTVGPIVQCHHHRVVGLLCLLFFWSSMLDGLRILCIHNNNAAPATPSRPATRISG
jgi:hypothetical protein